MTASANSASERKIEHRLVKGDYGSDADIGVFSIDMTEHDTRNHHWIHFPDGQVRKWYNWERIDKARAEEMEAFDMAPRLKVSYRPIAKELSNAYETMLILFFLALAALLIDGLIVLIADQFFDFADALLNSRIGAVVQDIIWITLSILGIICCVCHVGSIRWNNDTRDDEIPHAWYRAVQDSQRKEQDNGWI